MPASQGTSTLRRPISRFGLASINIDDRPNAYKDLQLVLKPQLDHAPRRPYTGSRPRMPVWRHFLMVHVKDKADELVGHSIEFLTYLGVSTEVHRQVKLDLDAFKASSRDANPAIRHSVACLFSRCSLIFQYPKDTDNVGNRALGPHAPTKSPCSPRLFRVLPLSVSPYITDPTSIQSCMNSAR